MQKIPLKTRNITKKINAKDITIIQKKQMFIFPLSPATVSSGVLELLSILL